MAYPLAPHIIELVKKELSFDDILAMLAYKTVQVTHDVFEDMANDDFTSVAEMLTKENLEGAAMDNVFISFPEMSMESLDDYPSDLKDKYRYDNGCIKALELTLATHIRDYISEEEQLRTFTLKL